MNSLLKEVENRLDVINTAHMEDDDLKVFTVRLPIGLIENLENIGTILQLKRTEVARMILTHGAAEIMKEYNMKFDSFGASFEDMYAVEMGEKSIEDVIQTMIEARDAKDE